MIELYILTFSVLIGALVFAAGILVGIKLYKHAQSPFMDVDVTPISEKLQGEEHHIDDEGFNWDEYDDYIATKLQEDIIDD